MLPVAFRQPVRGQCSPTGRSLWCRTSWSWRLAIDSAHGSLHVRSRQPPFAQLHLPSCPEFSRRGSALPSRYLLSQTRDYAIEIHVQIVRHFLRQFVRGFGEFKLSVSMACISNLTMVYFNNLLDLLGRWHCPSTIIWMFCTIAAFCVDDLVVIVSFLLPDFLDVFSAYCNKFTARTDLSSLSPTRMFDTS